jgi:EAL domain-containing protein (putative c-di-GMP-specific phosphodiesterase class I)
LAASSLDNHEDAIITAIVGLGRSLTQRVAGEGVETEEQLVFLPRHSCHEFQGSGYSCPISPGECRQLLSAPGQRPAGQQAATG